MTDNNDISQEILSTIKEIATALQTKNSIHPNDILTLKEAAALLKLSESTMNYYIDEKVITCQRIGKHKRFIRKELMDFLTKKNFIAGLEMGDPFQALSDIHNKEQQF